MIRWKEKFIGGAFSIHGTVLGTVRVHSCAQLRRSRMLKPTERSRDVLSRALGRPLLTMDHQVSYLAHKYGPEISSFEWSASVVRVTKLAPSLG